MPFYRVTLGDFEIIAIQAQPDRMANAKEMFPLATSDALDKAYARDPRFFGESSNELRFTQNICLIRTAEKLVLVDAGLPIDSPNAMLISGMAEAGLAPGDVDLVILTHRDLDHVGGAMHDGHPVFPNARFVIGESEFEGFRADVSRAEQFEKSMVPLQSLDRLDVVSDDAEVAPGIRLWLTPGHRSGATSILVSKEAVLLADAWHSAPQVTHPEWSIKFDSDPELAATTRAAVVERAERERLLVAVPHTPYFGLGRVERSVEGIPEWNPTAL
jgi:glyoxylase-like metal-dependent hydrolase (beta-lactamase superfamily II)